MVACWKRRTLQEQSLKHMMKQLNRTEAAHVRRLERPYVEEVPRWENTITRGHSVIEDVQDKRFKRISICVQIWFCHVLLWTSLVVCMLMFFASWGHKIYWCIEYIPCIVFMFFVIDTSISLFQSHQSPLHRVTRIHQQQFIFQHIIFLFKLIS